MAVTVLKGACWVFGDDVNTDEIIPAKFLVTTDAKELGRHAMDGVRPGFAERVKPGDLVVAGENFGCGSSREHAPLALKGAGIACVVAKSFARIFFRNAINIGLPIVESAEAAASLEEGEVAEVNLVEGVIVGPGGRRFTVAPFPGFLRRIIAAGGLMNVVRERLAGAAKAEEETR